MSSVPLDTHEDKLSQKGYRYEVDSGFDVCASECLRLQFAVANHHAHLCPDDAATS